MEGEGDSLEMFRINNGINYLVLIKLSHFFYINDAGTQKSYLITC